ncbi:MAG: hypothetical protein HY532_04870 [Chloroflexi bacterium]|nr:hypothetical protein [Chloroflexota bacterium]
MNAEEMLDKIHQGGYWRIVLHPTEFKPHRIGTLQECLAIIERSKVSLRGWDYPFVDPDNVIFGDNWISLAEDSEFEVEFWRFYQSGQFVHHLALPHEERHGKPDIELGDLIYQLTEVFEFAARLALRDVFNGSAVVNIQLNNIQDYTLRIKGSHLASARNYRSTSTNLEWKRSVPTLTLMGNAGDLALDVAEQFLGNFGYHADRTLLAADQARLLERRLGV